jgi:hypothetical protein
MIKSMTLRNSYSLLLFLPLAIVCLPARANSIDISTGPANWTVSIPVEGVSNAAPFSGSTTDGANICISSSCNSAGTWAGGGSLAGFDGFWTAQLTFTIPSGATGVSLIYPNFNADDRAVLELNGTTFASGPATGTGEMVLTDGGPNNPYTFLGNTSGTINSGFNIGGLNTIEVIINNTGNGIQGPPQNVSGGDFTYFSFTGAVSYTAGTSTPEPGSMGLAAGGLLYCLTRLRRRSRKL